MVDLSDSKVGEQAPAWRGHEEAPKTKSGEPVEQWALAIESSVLAVLLEHGPITEPQLLRSMTEAVNTPERLASIKVAIAGLVEAGLFIRDGEILGLTPAAQRLAEMEIGL